MSQLTACHLGRVQAVIELTGRTVAVPRTRGHLFSFRGFGSDFIILKNSEALLSAGEGFSVGGRMCVCVCLSVV